MYLFKRIGSVSGIRADSAKLKKSTTCGITSSYTVINVNTQNKNPFTCIYVPNAYIFHSQITAVFMQCLAEFTLKRDLINSRNFNKNAVTVDLMINLTCSRVRASSVIL